MKASQSEDSVRVPQKYPNKRHYKGPNIGQLSGNPLGKNPGDVWEISNVKNRHPEKTSHPKRQARTQVSGEIALDPFIDDLFSVDQTSTINPASNPVPSPGYPLAFETILVEPTM